MDLFLHENNHQTHEKCITKALNDMHNLHSHQAWKTYNYDLRTLGPKSSNRSLIANGKRSSFMPMESLSLSLEKHDGH